MKKTLALIIGSVIVIAFLAVFLASDEGAPVTTPIDTATTTAVVATTTLEKTELDLNEWKLFEETDLFSEGSEFWYPAEWVGGNADCNALSICRRPFFVIDNEVENTNPYQNGIEIMHIDTRGGCFIPAPDVDPDILFVREGFNKLSERTNVEKMMLFERPATKTIRYYESEDRNEKVTEYTLEINNINGPRHCVSLTMDDTQYTNTEEIFNEIIARMILGPIPEEDQQVIPIPPEFNQDT
jgi:hypothetical protein